MLLRNQNISFQLKKTTDCSKFVRLFLHENSVVTASSLRVVTLSNLCNDPGINKENG